MVSVGITPTPPWRRTSVMYLGKLCIAKHGSEILRSQAGAANQETVYIAIRQKVTRVPRVGRAAIEHPTRTQFFYEPYHGRGILRHLFGSAATCRYGPYRLAFPKHPS